MEINVYFGKKKGKCFYFDNNKPLKQIKKVKKLIKKEESFNISTYSPYVIEAVDIYKKKAEVKYFNDGKESDISLILSKINEAFYVMEEYRYKKIK
jgi:hypothetical protein